MNYKLHILKDNQLTDIQSGTSKQECLATANRLGYQLFDIVKQEPVYHQVIDEDGVTHTLAMVDEQGNTVMHDVTYPATHTYHLGDLVDIKKEAIQLVSSKALTDRQKIVPDYRYINYANGIGDYSSTVIAADIQLAADFRLEAIRLINLINSSETVDRVYEIIENEINFPTRR